jgi:hypothetical protein
MKTGKIIIFVFSMLTAFACNTQQSKRVNDKTSSIKNPASEKSTIKKIDNINEKSTNKSIEISEPNELKSCESLVKLILTTSPRYIQLTKGINEKVMKNGGLSYGISLEGSPNPRKDKAWRYSKTYDFTVYEMYIDRQLNTARFIFDPNNKKLYEYDAVQDQLKLIEFDTNLLLKLETFCK